jgi:SRSO17 transposase
LLLDDTSIPKQGKESVGVARQYCGALGKVANCQVVVTAALRTKKAVWPLAMDLYLPQEWCEDEDRRERARVPVGLKPRTKTETAIAQLDLVRAAGINITCVLADAGYGDATEFRDSIAKRKLFYSVGVAKTTKVFLDRPTLRVPEGRPGGRPRTRPELAPRSAKPKTLEQIANATPRSAWRSITWRKGTKGPLRAEFLIVRVTPAHRWYDGERFEQVWLICERTTGKESIRKYYLSNLPADLAAKKLVSITHERWAIEMHYRDLKQETALDHFEGRSFPGFNRHLVLTSIAYSFLERERRRTQSPLPSIGAVREAVTEVVVMMLFASGERFARRTLRFIRDPPRI